MTNNCSPAPAVCAAHSGIIQDIDNLKGWQKSQNGTLGELQRGATRHQIWIMTTLATTTLSLLLLVVQLLAVLAGGGR